VAFLNLIHRHDVALLLFDPVRDGRPRREAATPALKTCDDEQQILAANAELGHRVAKVMLRRRLANRLGFVAFSIDGQAVASTWLATGGRYIDELNWLLPIGPDEFWLRDVFVAPAWRGRRLFTGIVAALAAHGDGPLRRIWSDVDWDNAPSMRAHEAAGFRVVARVRALDVAGRVRLRSALPPWPLPVTEIDPTSRWIWLRGSRLRRHLELLA